MSPDFTLLNAAGLNLHAVFNLDAMPAEIVADLRQRFDPEHRFRQLILIGHGGRALWTAIEASRIDSENPIDDFTISTLIQWFRHCAPNHQQQIVYPGHDSIGLQALGTLAGWHHASPFMVGINADWGSWYAYRAVILSDTEFTPSSPLVGQSPCTSCLSRRCIASCPADALGNNAFDLKKCIDYRKSPESACQATCLARVACPVAANHRYSNEQLRHTYSISLQTIRRYY